MKAWTGRPKRVYSDPEVLDLFADEPELLAVVDAVAATQRRRRLGHGSRSVFVVAMATAAAVIVAAIVMPWHGGGRDVVGEALAAVGEAPVTDAVVSSNLLNDERVDLVTGRAVPVRVSVETFFDGGRNRMRVVIRHDGVVVADAVGAAAIRVLPGMTDVAGRLFSTGYRDALARHDASVVRRGRFAGHEAIWLDVEIDGRRQQVIINAHTYLPVGFRESTDGAVWAVDRFDSLARRQGQFATATEKQPEGGSVTGTRSTSLTSLAKQLRFRPVFAGRAFGGFRLTSVRSETLLSAGVRHRGVTGAALQYRDGRGTLVTVEQAAQPEAAYGFVRHRFTANLDPIPAGHVLSLSAQRGAWTGQLRSHGIYIRIASTQRRAVIAAARALRLLP